MPHILSPLRSRLAGGGYEVLLDTTMPDTEVNRAKMAQFVAQEVTVDKKIPHASRAAVLAVIEESKRRARDIDHQEKALTLRLRELGGRVGAGGGTAGLRGAT